MVEGVPRGGSLIKRCACSGITTYPINRKPVSKMSRALALFGSGNRR